MDKKSRFEKVNLKFTMNTFYLMRAVNNSKSQNNITEFLLLLAAQLRVDVVFVLLFNL